MRICKPSLYIEEYVDDLQDLYYVVVDNLGNVIEYFVSYEAADNYCEDWDPS